MILGLKLIAAKLKFVGVPVALLLLLGLIVHHFASLPAFDFYNDRYSVGCNIIRGTFRIESETDTLMNKKRVWLLMTHIGETEKNRILDRCKKDGRTIDEFEYGGGYTVLCNFNH